MGVVFFGDCLVNGNEKGGVFLLFCILQRAFVGERGDVVCEFPLCGFLPNRKKRA